MIVSMDLFREGSVAAIAFGPDHKSTATIPCAALWDRMTLSSQEDFDFLASFLKKLCRFLADKYNEQIEYAGFVVPYDFTYLQKTRIINIAKQAGMHRARCCNALSLVACEFECGTEENRYFFCRLEGDRVEFCIACAGNDVIENFGLGGLRIAPGEDTAEFQKRLATEINLFFKETHFTWDFLNHLILVGSTPRFLVSLLESLSGKTCYKMKDNIVNDLNLHLLALVGDAGLLFLHSQNVSLWAALGDAGEKGIAIDRYTTIPAFRGVKLLLSTEKTLNIYEGNFINPKFDTKIAAVDLSFIKEGSEIECVLTINSEGWIDLSVKNDRGEELLHKLLPSF